MTVSTYLALLVSGQFRAVDGISASLNRLDGIDLKLFVSTWKNKGLKSGGWISTKQIQVLLGRPIGNAFPADLYGDCAGLLKLLPEFERALHHSMATLGQMDAEFVRDIGAADFDIEDDDLHFGVNIDQTFNEERLLYKTLRAIRLMERWERTTGKRFTHILRLRPDALVLDDRLPHKLDERLYFDWRGLGGADGRQVERVGDNIILAPRDAVVTLVTESLRDVTRRMVVERERSDIHAVLARHAAASGLETGDVPMEFCSGEWPAEAFITALDRKAAESADHTMLRGFYHHIRAGQALEQGHYATALESLARVPSDRQGKMNHSRIAALAHQGLGQHDAALDAAKRFRAEWDGSHPATKENMYSLLSDLQSILPL